MSAVDRKRLTDAGAIASTEDLDDLVVDGRSRAPARGHRPRMDRERDRRGLAPGDDDPTLGARGRGLPERSARRPPDAGRRLRSARGVAGSVSARPRMARDRGQDATARRTVGARVARGRRARVGAVRCVRASPPMRPASPSSSPPRSTASICRRISPRSRRVLSRRRSTFASVASRSANRGLRHPPIASPRSRWSPG